MKVGDKVRFLDSVGGGKITSIDSRGMVMVEDEDGFEIPALASQCVVIDDEEDQRQAGHAPVHQAPLTKTQKIAREALSEVDRLKEENRQLKEQIHALNAEMADLKLAMLKLQFGSKNESKNKGKGQEQTQRKPYEVLRDGIIEVDLHIHNLVDNTAGMDNTAMLRKQMEVFEDTMQSYIKAKNQKIVFIHGKGEGVLRKSILDEVKRKYKTCETQDASFQRYGFGATMVIIH